MLSIEALMAPIWFSHRQPIPLPPFLCQQALLGIKPENSRSDFNRRQQRERREANAVAA
jgi:hypothetical protein